VASLDVIDVSRYKGVEGRASKEQTVGASITSVEHVVALYPGEFRGILLRIYGPRGHVVVIAEQGFLYSVVHLEIAPSQARAPLNAEVVVSAKHEAAPGVYLWNLRVVDAAKNRVLGERANNTSHPT